MALGIEANFLIFGGCDVFEVYGKTEIEASDHIHLQVDSIPVTNHMAASCAYLFAASCAYLFAASGQTFSESGAIVVPSSWLRLWVCRPMPVTPQPAPGPALRIFPPGPSPGASPSPHPILQSLFLLSRFLFSCLNPQTLKVLLSKSSAVSA